MEKSTKEETKPVMAVRGILFAVVAAALFLGVERLSESTRVQPVFSDLTDSSEIVYVGYWDVSPAIERVGKEDKTTKLLLGDSVADQVFPAVAKKNKKKYCIATTNMSVLMSGQYLMAKRYLDTHPKATDVYLMMAPTTLQAQLDSTVYMYAVAPFISNGMIKELDKDTLALMRERYGRLALTRPFSHMAVHSPPIAKTYLHYLSEGKDYYDAGYPVELTKENVFSDNAYQYLQKIYELCGERGVTFHFISMPMGDYELSFTRIALVKEDMGEHGLDGAAAGYFESQIIYEPDNFSEGCHLNFKNFNAKDVIRDIQEKTGELEDLKL